MKSIEELQDMLVAHKYGLGDLKECVDWAVERLLRNEDDGDEDIALLAGSSDDSETNDLAQKIIHRYLQPSTLEEKLWAGKFLVRLNDRYKAGTISIVQLEPIIEAMYRNLEYPNWLVMLSRNCEYATDIESFEVPFEDEFEYISDLWKKSKSSDEFDNKYDRHVSNTHDMK